MTSTHEPTSERQALLQRHSEADNKAFLLRLRLAGMGLFPPTLGRLILPPEPVPWQRKCALVLGGFALGLAAGFVLAVVVFALVARERRLQAERAEHVEQVRGTIDLNTGRAIER